MTSSTETIFVALLNEGTSVWRPTQAVALGQGVYRVLATPDYVRDEEIWEFPPGSVVRTRVEIRNGEKLSIADERVTD
jgi:hypothetical protein